MGALPEVEWLLVVGLPLLLALAITAVVLRRRSIAKGCPVALAAISKDGARWRLGLVRLGPSTLAWFPVVALTTRPRLQWERAHLELTTPADELISIPGLSQAVQVEVSDAVHTEPCPIAVERGVYMAMRSWLESAPPGADVNVA